MKLATVRESGWISGPGPRSPGPAVGAYRIVGFPRCTLADRSGR